MFGFVNIIMKVEDIKFLYKDDYLDFRQLAKLFNCFQYVTKNWFDRGLKHVEHNKKKYASYGDVCEYITGGYA